MLCNPHVVINPVQHPIGKSAFPKICLEVALWEVCRPDLVTTVTRRSRKPLGRIVGKSSKCCGEISPRKSNSVYECVRFCGIGPTENLTGPYCDLRLIGLPIATRKMAALPVACGEKKLITSSSKKVSPVAPKP